MAGWLEESRQEDDSSKDNNDDDKTSSSFWQVNLTEGRGWDLDDGTGSVSPHTDAEHWVYMEQNPLLAPEQPHDQTTTTLIVAKGTNDFGPFVSAGYQFGVNKRRMLIARRYLEEGDPRTKWSVAELYRRIQTTASPIDTVTVVPNLLMWHRGPWRTLDLHASQEQIFVGATTTSSSLEEIFILLHF